MIIGSESIYLDPNWLIFAKGKSQVTLMNILNNKINSLKLLDFDLPIYDSFDFAKQHDILEFIAFKYVKTGTFKSGIVYNWSNIYQYKEACKARFIQQKPKSPCNLTDVLSLENRLFKFKDVNLRDYYNMFGKYLFDCEEQKHKDFVDYYKQYLNDCEIYRFIRDEIHF